MFCVQTEFLVRRSSVFVRSFVIIPNFMLVWSSVVVPNFMHVGPRVPMTLRVRKKFHLCTVLRVRAVLRVIMTFVITRCFVFIRSFVCTGYPTFLPVILVGQGRSAFPSSEWNKTVSICDDFDWRRKLYTSRHVFSTTNAAVVKLFLLKDRRRVAASAI
jgi:hypothetical protein